MYRAHTLICSLVLTTFGCSDDTASSSTNGTEGDGDASSETGDGDGPGDGDGDPSTGDGDGDPSTGDGDGDPGTGDGDGDGDGDGGCFEAELLWFEDFESGTYDAWTGGYDPEWSGCTTNGFSSEYAVSGTQSHWSAISCGSGNSHRGYGGVQFDGDTPLPAYTNVGVGTDAPYGIVNTYWSRLSVPYTFGNGRWFSYWTINSDCGWNEDVITLGLEEPSHRLTPAHIVNTGGTVTFEPDAPTVALDTWMRTTIYINLVDETIHIWHDGQKLLSGEVARPTSDVCQWHWGAYASGDNDDVQLWEDDISIWKLQAPWPDFAVEPYFGETIEVCDG
ncbi:hypothetical protein ENSA5_56270 [Enhygromyxa salina]|uniref:Endo-1,4-beta-xylanase A n=1 Tax=Enhygromyxa salina TaxID=215803 RepID=A0A2S9XFB0_9BACT|nr:hypothetical protein [Enhygromyxa salina]PRP91361.1 hypothetical protein ENSA5_56270 [Enhygromyxa salina]